MRRLGIFFSYSKSLLLLFVQILFIKYKQLTHDVSVPSEVGNQNHISYLTDDLLVEIFRRLPGNKFATQCKCVCKRWAALVPHLQFAIVSRVCYSCISSKTWKGIIMHLKDPILNRHEFSFAPLPCLVDGDVTSTDLTVVGASNDLLLYCRDKFEDRLDYYIYNLQTKQWLKLPSLFYLWRSYTVGFVCDSYYSNGNTAYRYSIVVLPYVLEAASMMSAYLFSSNTSHQWTKIVLSLGKPCRMLGTDSFAHAGMLHFRGRDRIIFGFNPYSGVSSYNPDIDDNIIIIYCHLIRMPAGFKYGSAGTGLRHGCLQMFGVDDDQTLHVWVLKNYKKGKWCLLHRIAINDLVHLNPLITTFPKVGCKDSEC